MTEKLNQRQVKALERRQMILQAAKKLFAENGFHATTTRSINKEIGMADGLLYHYFPNGKREILETIIEEEMSRKMESFFSMMDNIDVEEGLETVLQKLGSILLNTGTRDRELIVIMFRENNLLVDSALHQAPQIMQQFIARIEAIFQTFIDRGEIRKLDTRFMVVQFFGQFTLYFIYSILFEDSLIAGDEKAYLNKAVEQTLKAWRA